MNALEDNNYVLRDCQDYLRVFIVVDFLDCHGGVSKSLTLMAQLLRKAGHSVSVFVEKPVRVDNQYVQVLQEAGIPVISPHPIFAWMGRQLDIGNFLLILLVPIRLVLSLVSMSVLKRSFWRAWIGVRGWLNWYIPHRVVVEPERLSLYGLLTIHSFINHPSIIYVARGVAGLRWASWYKVPSVFVEASVPGSELGLDWWDILKKDIKYANGVIAVCHQGRQGIKEYCGYGGPIFVLPWIVEDFVVKEMEVVQTYSKDDALIIGTAGRLNREKGQAWLVSAIPEVLKSLALPVKLWIAGDGPDRALLEKLTIDLGIQDNVYFLGHQDQIGMEQFWEHIDLFVSPSLLEAVPFVLIEAMARSKPIVATDVGGVRDLLNDGQCGVCVPAQDAGVLAQAIIRVLNDPSYALEIAKAGRKRFESRYRPEVAFPKWLEVYKQIVSAYKIAGV